MESNSTSQNCTRKRMIPYPESSPERGKSYMLLENLKGQYYMNLSLLKKRKMEGSGEESDKSLAVLVNMLANKEENKEKNLHRDAIIQKDSQMNKLNCGGINFNRVIRLNMHKGEQLETIESAGSSKIGLKEKGERTPNSKGFVSEIPKSPARSERSPLHSKILFTKKLEIKGKDNGIKTKQLNLAVNLILDKKKLQQRLKCKKKIDADKLRNIKLKTRRELETESHFGMKSNPKHSLSPNCKGLRNLKKKQIQLDLNSRTGISRKRTTHVSKGKSKSKQVKKKSAGLTRGNERSTQSRAILKKHKRR